MAAAKSRRKTARRTKKSNSRMWIWFLVMALFLGELLFYAWCRVQCVRLGYEIAAQTRKNQELIALQESLKIEITRLKAPERIIRIARQRLGLTMPAPEQIKFIK
jgi:cell division protein FtsL